ncbi:MAG: asparagine synthase (glutamine-hydrolyzing) [Bdellovibrionota bacterium]
MCGIAGTLSKLAPGDFRATLDRMTDALSHRGPDARGTCTFEGPLHVGLGHRRLSILDLSETGAQPMHSARYSLVFNGEIYNHLSLRESLGGKFRGTSDTETLLSAFEKWGVPGTLERAAGMFAIAVWDKQERQLILARDRMGEKPLYYGRAGGDFVFGSELGALRAHPGLDRGVNHEALRLMLTLGYVPAPLSIHPQIFKLPPASWLRVSESGNFGEPQSYWDLREVAARAPHAPPGSLDGEIERTLATVVREQRLSDVPLGCFLSGGIDSSLIAAMMTEGSASPPRTFSIGFAQGGFDESAFARSVAEKLGTQHTELQASPADALSLVPDLCRLYDEPFADASQIPTILLARLARPHVTVALTGDGGDEVFAGYNRYLFLDRARHIPGFAAPALSMAARFAGTPAMQSFERTARLPHIGEKLRKLSQVTKSGSESAAYWALAAQGLLDAAPYAPVESLAARLHGVPGLQLRDQLLYLPDDILVKVDRASMSASLETRAPFLDHRIVELAWRLPLADRVSGSRGKIVLRRLLGKRLDPRLWQRPKAGFTPPIGKWLCGNLREWAENLLSERALAGTDLPGAAGVREEWKQVKSREGAGALRLWPALMAQAWLTRES